MTISIGMIEVSSIANGYEVLDTVVKAASIKTLLARTVCPGKYIVVIKGRVDAVKMAIQAGTEKAAGFLVDNMILSNVDERVFPALTGGVEVPQNKDGAMGIIETFTSSAIIEAADAAVKAAHVCLLRVHVCMAIGGKGYLILSGDLSAVRSSVQSGITAIQDKGDLTNKVVISRPSPEVFNELI